MLPRVAV